MSAKLFLFPTFVILGMACSAVGQAQTVDLMITGVMDGTLTGGRPKVAEIYAINAIPNLSLYALSRASNGSATFDPITADFVLPNVSLAAGSFYYAVGNSFEDQTIEFDTVFPAYAGIRSRNFGVNSNGDDVTGLFFNPTGDFVGTPGSTTQLDAVGELGVDGTGTPWEHLDGWIYSKDGRAPSTTFDVNQWNLSGIDVMDGLDAAGIAASFPDQTFIAGAGPADDADFDGDGDIDGEDFLIFQRNLTSTPGTGTQPNGDANNDGLIDNADLDVFKTQFGTSVVAAGAVPEPGTLGLVACGLVAVAGVARRRGC